MKLVGTLQAFLEEVQTFAKSPPKSPKKSFCRRKSMFFSLHTCSAWEPCNLTKTFGEALILSYFYLFIYSIDLLSFQEKRFKRRNFGTRSSTLEPVWNPSAVSPFRAFRLPTVDLSEPKRHVLKVSAGNFNRLSRYEAIVRDEVTRVRAGQTWSHFNDFCQWLLLWIFSFQKFKAIEPWLIQRTTPEQKCCRQSSDTTCPYIHPG